MEGKGAWRCPEEVPIQPEELAAQLARFALEKKAFDLVILDMRKLVDYADVFVICTARNRRQVEAIAEAVRLGGKEIGQRPEGLEGMATGRWVLVDFGDVIVHVFDEAMRGFYDLDGLWRDAPRLDTPDVGPVGPDEDDDETPAASAKSFFSFTS